MPRPRVLLAWESGDGRGHLSKLKAMAVLLGQDFVYDAALCRMQNAGELTPLCDLVFPCAYLPYSRERRRAAGSPPTATWGEFLGDLGFTDTGFLIRQIDWWGRAIRARASSMVVGDFSPCAILAARALGVPSVTLGRGYTVPPASMAEFPVLLPEFARRIYDEGQMVEALNGALRHFGLPCVDHLPQLYEATQGLPRTLALLDPYAAQRKHRTWPPLDAPPPLAGAGDEVFAYFSTSEATEQALIAALCQLGLPVRLFMPGLEAELAGRLAASGVHIEHAPLAPAEIARRARIMVHAGQHGSLCMALGMGLPQIALPQQLEQQFHAWRAEMSGTVHVLSRAMRAPDAIVAAIRAAYDDVVLAARARDLARTLRQLLASNEVGALRDAVLSHLSAA